MKLSLRLQTIHDMVPKGTVIDIGADHGKLVIALFQNGIISHAYAVENKQGPYSRLVSAIKEAGLENDITPILSDGIKDLPSHVDTVIIAGMGGNNIIDILKKYPAKEKQIQTLIVDAHSCVPKLRQEVTAMGFIIADEKIIQEDGIYYEIIKFIRAKIAFYGDQDYEFGPILRNEKSQVFKEKYLTRIEEIDYILKTNDLPEDRIEQLSKEKERIRSIL
jgi:tRNA (adenine22-N1)-methyltransferase